MRAWIIGEMDLIKAAVNTVPGDQTPEGLLGDKLRLLIATTGPMSSVEAWQWGPGIRSRKGKQGVETMLVDGGGSELGEKKCRISAAITDPEELTPADVVGLMQLAGAVTATDSKWADVLNYKCFVKVQLANMTDDVPAYLPKRTYTDDEGTEQTHTWTTWATQRLTAPVEDETHAYVSTTAGGQYPLAGSVLAQLSGAGLEIVSPADVPQPAE